MSNKTHSMSEKTAKTKSILSTRLKIENIFLMFKRFYKVCPKILDPEILYTKQLNNYA